MPVAMATGVYQTIFRFAGSGTMMAIARAMIIYSVPFSIICMVYTLPAVPRTIGLLQPIIFFMLLAFSRILVRYLLTDIMRTKGFRGDLRKILIYGAGASGRQLASSLAQEPGFQVVGFVDDDKRLDGHLIDNKRIYHAYKLDQLMETYDVTDIVLAMPRNSKSKNRQIVESLADLDVRVKTLPPIADLVDGNISADVVRDINVVDLLGRDPVPPNELLLSKTIFGKTVLVTGAGGSIGSELCKQIIRLRPKRLIMVEMAEYALYRIEQDLLAELASDTALEIIPELANIAEQSVVDRLFQRWVPDTVFHAAAYKHVPLVEHNPVGGMRNNIFGTYFCAKAAEKTNVANFILVSTDKAVRPTNVMGATKRVCELILQAFAHDGSKTKFVMVRFGNVLGSSGSVVPRFEQQIRAGGPVTLTDKRITRYFMTIPEAAQLVIQAGALANAGEVCVLDMGKSVKIIDLAKSMIRLSGLTLKDEENPNGDVEIIEVGLRPGEKLYEELLIGDSPEPTVHKRIFKAKEHFIPRAEIEELLTMLRSYLLAGKSGEALELLRKLVPEFRSPEEMEGVA
jgi:FlaA1/EpsC-like NDP-sugar epimerase